MKTNTNLTPERDKHALVHRDAPASAFCAEHGPVDDWSPGLYDLYLDLFSTPTPRRTEGAIT